MEGDAEYPRGGVRGVIPAAPELLIPHWLRNELTVHRGRNRPFADLPKVQNQELFAAGDRAALVAVGRVRTPVRAGLHVFRLSHELT